MINLKRFIPFVSAVSLNDKVLFTKHLALMLKSGLPLRESVRIISEQVDSKSFKNILKDIVERLNNGESLSSSLANHSKVFSSLSISIIKIGEESGTLDKNLSYLSDQLQNNYKLRQEIIGAMLYPFIILIVTIFMLLGLAFYVLPQFVEFYQQSEFPLPLPTRILLKIISLLENQGLIILGGFIGFLFLFYLLSRIRFFKKINHYFLLKFPVVRSIVKYKNLTEFSRNMSILLKSGVPVMRSLEIASDSMDNLIYKDSLKELSKEIRGGESISENLKKHPLVFPKITPWIVSAGEKSGSLVESLEYLSDFYEDEVKSITENLSTILEPALLLFVGLIVGLVVVSIILPIYKLSSYFGM